MWCPGYWRERPRDGSRWASTPASWTVWGTASCSPPGVRRTTWRTCWLATLTGVFTTPAWEGSLRTRSSTTRRGWVGDVGGIEVPSRCLFRWRTTQDPSDSRIQRELCLSWLDNCLDQFFPIKTFFYFSFEA